MTKGERSGNTSPWDTLRRQHRPVRHWIVWGIAILMIVAWANLAGAASDAMGITSGSVRSILRVLVIAGILLAALRLTNRIGTR